MEDAVAHLHDSELGKFRAWFARFDAEARDREFENMKCITAICLVSMLCGCTLPVKTPSTISQIEREPELAVRAQVDEAVLDAVIESLNAGRTVPNATACETQVQAQMLLLRNCHLIIRLESCPFSEHKGYFLFAGPTSVEPDDGSFRSGYAVKKGTAEIYFWERKQSTTTKARTTE